MTTYSGSLRGKLLSGGVLLAGREAAGVFLSLIAVTIVFRRVDPSEYALVGLALTLSGFLARVGALGVDTYIARYPGSLPDELAQRLMAVAICAATCAAAGMIAAAIPVERALNIPGAAHVTWAIAAYLWLWIVSRIPVAALEHGLRFRQLALAELSSLIVYTVLAVALALAGASAWSIVVATVAQGATVFALAFATNPIRPRFDFVNDQVGRALAFGLPYQLSVWLWSTRDLVGPFVVGWLLGTKELGLLAGAALIASRAAFIRPIVWRVSIAGFGKIQDDPRRLRQAVSAGMTYQLLALGLTFTGFALLAPWVVPLAVGEAWGDVAVLFPLLAIGLLANAVFTLHCSSLFARGAVREMTLFHLVHVATLAMAAFALVDRWGLIGYGMAEIVALWTYVLPHLFFTRLIGAVAYSVPLTIGGLTIMTLATIALGGVVLGSVIAALAIGALTSVRTVRTSVSRAAVALRRPAAMPTAEVPAR